MLWSLLRDGSWWAAWQIGGDVENGEFDWPELIGLQTNKQWDAFAALHSFPGPQSVSMIHKYDFLFILFFFSNRNYVLNVGTLQ